MKLILYAISMLLLFLLIMIKVNESGCNMYKNWIKVKNLKKPKLKQLKIFRFI